MTNQKFAETKIFIDTCRIANVKPTTRQASKFRMKKGAAFKIGTSLINHDVHIPVHARFDPKA